MSDALVLIVALAASAGLLSLTLAGSRALWDRGRLSRAQARDVERQLPRAMNRQQRRARAKQGPLPR